MSQGRSRNHHSFSWGLKASSSSTRSSDSRRRPSPPPRSRQLEQQNLFALDPSHRSGLRREPEAVLDLAVELQLASALGDPAEVPVHVCEVVQAQVHDQRVAELLAELDAPFEIGEPILVTAGRADRADSPERVCRNFLGTERLRLGEPLSPELEALALSARDP